MYSGARFIRVHGAISHALVANSGIVPGCAFAVHYLKAYLSDMPQVIQWGQNRDYVDDLVLSAAGKTPLEVVQNMEIQLSDMKDYLLRRGLIINESKEQIYAPQSVVQHLWNKKHPDYEGQVTSHAKDLGAAQRTGKTAGILRNERVSKIVLNCAMIEQLPLPRGQKLIIVRVSVLPGALYGSDIEPLTQKQLGVLRQAIAKIVCGTKAPHQRMAALLLSCEGKAEPYVCMMQQVVSQWVRQVHTWTGWGGDTL
jgi:hypothetical protein